MFSVFALLSVSAFALPPISPLPLFDGRVVDTAWVDALVSASGDDLIDWGSNGAGRLWVVVDDGGQIRGYDLDATHCTTGPCYAGYLIDSSVTVDISTSFHLDVDHGIEFDGALSLYQRRGGAPTYLMSYNGSADLHVDAGVWCDTLDVSGHRYIYTSLEAGRYPFAMSTLVAYGAWNSWYGYGWAVGGALGGSVIPSWFSYLAAADLDGYTGTGSHHLDGLLPRVGEAVGDAFSARWDAVDTDLLCEELLPPPI